MKHTPEPWEVVGEDMPYIATGEGYVIACASQVYPECTIAIDLDDANRIVACVNALAGKDPAVVEEMVEVLRDINKIQAVTSPLFIPVSEKAKAILERMEG